MTRFTKRALSLLLTIAMIFSMSSLPIFAEEEHDHAHHSDELAASAPSPVDAELDRQIREAGEARKRAEAEAERIRKELATSAPELVRFKLYFKGFQEQFMEAQEALREVAQRDPDTAGKLQKAMLTALDNCIAGVKEVGG